LEAGSLCHLGWCNQLEGKFDHAHGQLEAALAVARDLGDVRFESDILWLLGKVYESTARPDKALDHFEAGLVIARELEDRFLERRFLGYLGLLHARQAPFDQALDHLEAALVIARELEDRFLEGESLGHLGLLHARQAHFHEARGCLNAGEALLRANSGRVRLAILLCARAEMEHLTGNPDAARAALAEADSFDSAVAAGPGSELGLAIARVRDLLGK
jgi:tetratricopeptide (TPR) repeat protein